MAKPTRRQRHNAVIREKIKELIQLRRLNVFREKDNLSKYFSYFTFFRVKRYLSIKECFSFNKNKDIDKAIKQLKSKIK